MAILSLSGVRNFSRVEATITDEGLAERSALSFVITLASFGEIVVNRFESTIRFLPSSSS